MSKHVTTGGISRRGFGAGLGAATLAAGTVGFPAILKGQTQTVKIGLIHPVTGFLAFAGQQCRYGCELAIADINARGGIKSMGGAKLEALLGDSQAKPEIGAAEVEKMKEAGVHGFSGCYQSPVGLAATQAAAKYNLPFSIDVGVSDRLVQRGLKNVFRMSAGFGSITTDAVANLGAINKAAGSPAKSAVIVHEESEYGTGTAKLLAEKLPGVGIQVLEVMKHANPTRNFDNVALRIKGLKPDIVIPINYPGEYVLLARTLKQQKVDLVAIYSVLGGGFNLKFIKEQPDVAAYMIDVNHWYNPKSKAGQEMRKRVEADRKWFTFEVYSSYMSVEFLASGIERAGATDPEKVIAALAATTWTPEYMPYGPTKIVDGQNQGGRAVAIQALNGDAEVVFPTEFASAKAVYPAPKS